MLPVTPPNWKRGVGSSHTNSKPARNHYLTIITVFETMLVKEMCFSSGTRVEDLQQLLFGPVAGGDDEEAAWLHHSS